MAPNCTLYTYEGNDFFLYDYGTGEKFLEEIRAQSPLLALPAFHEGKRIALKKYVNIQRRARIEAVLIERDTDHHPFALLDLPNLKEIQVDPENPYFSTDGHCLYTKDGKTLLAAPCRMSKGEALIIPAAVTSIDKSAFLYSHWTAVEFENPDLDVSPDYSPPPLSGHSQAFWSS